jgi:hypothetical protein
MRPYKRAGCGLLNEPSNMPLRSLRVIAAQPGPERLGGQRAGCSSQYVDRQT